MKAGRILGTLLALVLGACLFLSSAQAPAPVLRREVFINAAQVYVLQSACVQCGQALVFVNGLLMAPNLDYSLSGARLVFFANQRVVQMDHPVIQVLYWSLP